MQTQTRVLRIPCADPLSAAAAANFLHAEHNLDVLGSDGRHLLVPAGWSPRFVWGLAELLGDYADDAELAAWATEAASAVRA